MFQMDYQKLLHQLYLENVKPKVVEDVSSGNNNIDMEMTSDQDVSLVRDSTQITTPSATMNVQSLIEQARVQDTPPQLFHWAEMITR